MQCSGAGLQAFYRRVTLSPAPLGGELGFKQSSLHRDRAGLADTGPTLSDRSRLPTCFSPVLGFRFEVGRLTQESPPNSSRLNRESYAAVTRRTFGTFGRLDGVAERLLRLPHSAAYASGAGIQTARRPDKVKEEKDR